MRKADYTANDEKGLYRPKGFQRANGVEVVSKQAGSLPREMRVSL